MPWSWCSEELDLWGIPIAGLAKENEMAVRAGPGGADRACAGVARIANLVMRVRDEAHRFAVEYHRVRRGKAMTQSALDALAGVGPVRRKRLLTTFGSVNAIKRAASTRSRPVKGMTPALAASIKESLSASRT